jgi:hypothetical protein
MDMPKPTDAHRQLEKLAGNWVGEETLYPSSFDPKGGTATSRMTGRMAVGGFALISDYQQERGGVTTFQGHGVFTYEPNSGEYAMYWVDSIGMPGETFHGRLDGSILTLTSRGPMGSFRISYDVGTPRQLKSHMDTSQDGVNWQPLFDSVYAPAPAAKPAAPKKSFAKKPSPKKAMKKAPTRKAAKKRKAKR